MTLLQIYRAGIIISMALYAVWFLLPNAGLPLSNEIHSIMEWNFYNEIVSIPAVINWIMFLLFNMASIGMLFFKRECRDLFLILMIGSFILTPLRGVSVMTAIDASIGYYITIIDGFILALAYYSELSDNFK